MVPEFDPQTNALPPGIHEATWSEVVERFGTSPKRRELLAGMRDALRALAYARVTRVYLAGSFVTARPEAEGRDPGDWDACYEASALLEERLPPAILEESPVRMKARYGGEVYLTVPGMTTTISSRSSSEIARGARWA